MQITSGGEVIIADQKVLRSRYNSTDDYSATFNWVSLQLGNNGPNRIIGGKTATGGSLEFYVNNTNEASAYGVTPNGNKSMTLDSTGDILFGTTGIPNGTSIYGSAFEQNSGGRMTLLQASSTTSSTTLQAFFNPNGVVGSIATSSSSTIYYTSSDYRLKENVVEMTGALDRVDALKPSRFNFIADPDKTIDGFLAHEVQDIVPEAIGGVKDEVDEEGNEIYQGIDHSKLVPLLVGAIKELNAKVAALEAQINN